MARELLVRDGFRLEYATLGWNIAGVFVLAAAIAGSGSVALISFGLDTLLEIGASSLVIWELSGAPGARQERALRAIGVLFLVLGIYLLAQSTVAILSGHRAQHSPLGIVWTALTAAAMFALATGKARVGRALENSVIQTEGRVTFIDGVLAVSVLIGLVADSALGAWWADPLVGYVIAGYALREAHHTLRGPA